MPEALDPETLASEQDLAQKMAHLLPEKVQEKFIAERPLEFRTVQIHNPLKGHVDEPVRQVWIRANGGLPANLHIHQHLPGYASDLNFLQPHCKDFLEADCRSPPSTTQCDFTAR